MTKIGHCFTAAGMVSLSTSTKPVMPQTLISSQSGKQDDADDGGVLRPSKIDSQRRSLLSNIPQDMDGVVSKLRDFLTVDHVVYYSTKLEAPTVPYIRLTYPASWVKRYLQMGYGRSRSYPAGGVP